VTWLEFVDKHAEGLGDAAGAVFFVAVLFGLMLFFERYDRQ